MAEYKAKLLNNVFKQAKNVLLSDGTPITNINISSSEQEIGMLGSKKIYRRTYTISNQPIKYGQATVIDANLTNSYIDTIIKISGSVKMSYGATLPFTDYGFDIVSSAAGLSMSWSVSGGDYTMNSGHLIIEYTKV